MSKRALLIPVAAIVAGVAVLAFVNIYLARWAARALPVSAEGETVFRHPSGRDLGRRRADPGGSRTG